MAANKLELEPKQVIRARAGRSAACGGRVEANGLSKAIASYETASALAPAGVAYHWRLVDLYLNASRADKMLAQLRYLAEQLPTDSQTRDWYRYYKRAYDFDGQ